MASFDLGSRVALSYSVNPAAATDDVLGTAVDTAGFEAVCAFGLSAGASALDASNYFTLTIKEGDTTVEANATAVPANRIISNSGRLDAANKVIKATFRPAKRYVFIGLAETGTADATVGSAVLLGDANKQPV